MNYSVSHKSLEAKDDFNTLSNVTCFITGLIENFYAPFEEMLFGGTEKEIIERGSDWCTDISRVGATLLQCLGIPSRIVILVDSSKAYHGHQVVEAYVKKSYVVCDFLYGVIGKEDEKCTIYNMLNQADLVKIVYQSKIKETAKFDYLSGLYKSAAIAEYDITQRHNYYISKPNEYYLKMMKLNQNGEWQMSENDSNF